MVILEIADNFTQVVQEIAFGLSLLISGLFFMEYKKYKEQQEKKEMLDQFLND